MKSIISRMGVVVWCLVLTASAVWTQELEVYAPEGVTVEAEATRGEPYGVGQVRVTLPDSMVGMTPMDETFSWQVTGDGVLYPVLVLDSTPGTGATPSTVVGFRVYFLTKGEGPVVAKIYAQSFGTQRVQVTMTPTPTETPLMEQPQARRWWSTFTQRAQRMMYSDVTHPMVNQYLVSMLKRRLGTNTAIYNYRYPGMGREMERILGVLLGMESVRAAMQKDVFLERTDEMELPDQPLPKATMPPAIELPTIEGEPVIEPIALRVPKECYYLRCGSFSNFLHLRGLVDRWGGNLRQLVAMRGIDYELGHRMQTQLSLRESVLSKIFGPAVVDDVAIIGFDPFFKEGAGFGILFKALNDDLLGKRLRELQGEAKGKRTDVKEEKITVGDATIHAVTTPDNRVRSFYVQSGEYHLVTTSLTLAKRFLATATDGSSLGETDEFQYIRTRMPADGNDKAFLYLSDSWFRLLLSPAYRIEMTRRMKSTAMMDLVQLAHLTAKAETGKEMDLGMLEEEGYLPPSYDLRPEGGTLEFSTSGMVDSLRGARGSFCPIADMEVTSATASEVEAYKQFADSYRRVWTRMDPVAVRLTAIPPQGTETNERYAAEIYISPYAQRHYAFLRQFLYNPTTTHVRPHVDDLLFLSLNFKFGVDKMNRSPYAYAGLQDSEIPYTIENGSVHETVQPERHIDAYFGLYPKTAMPFLLPPPDPEKLDEDGYMKGPNEWYRVSNEFSTVGVKKDVLEKVTPNLQFNEAKRPAQLRLWIRPLGKTKLATLITALGYTKARSVSNGNLLFLRSLVRDLKVPAEEAIATAETLLGGRLQCPLGGTYKVGPDELHPLASTAWEPGAPFTAVPDDYRFPLLDWFSMMQLEFSIDETTLDIRTELEVTPLKTNRVPAGDE